MTDDTAEGSKPRQAPKRKPIYVLVPHDIDDVDVKRQQVDEEDHYDEDGKRLKVESTLLESTFSVYVVPGGLGQKEAILAILKKHNIDLKNIDRVRMFKGEKKFRVETQYNIRF